MIFPIFETLVTFGLVLRAIIFLATLTIVSRALKSISFPRSAILRKVLALCIAAITVLWLPLIVLAFCLLLLLFASALFVLQRPCVMHAAHRLHSDSSSQALPHAEN